MNNDLQEMLFAIDRSTIKTMIRNLEKRIIDFPMRRETLTRLKEIAEDVYKIRA